MEELESYQDHQISRLVREIVHLNFINRIVHEIIIHNTQDQERE
jgi:hypothetical protein